MNFAAATPLPSVTEFHGPNAAPFVQSLVTTRTFPAYVRIPEFSNTQSGVFVHISVGLVAA